MLTCAFGCIRLIYVVLYHIVFHSHICTCSLIVSSQVSGDHCKDVLQLGDSIRVEDQVFAQVKSLHQFTTCEAEEGVFGLAFTMISSHNYPSLLSNLDNTLLHSIYSLYLSAKDDYPPDMSTTYSDFDQFGNLEYGGARPLQASSQIVFGGVDQRHYEGCLHWHDLGQFEDLNTGETFQGYWDFALEEVRVGGTQMPTSSLALVDSGSSYIVGPPEDVSQFAVMNSATCFDLTDPDNAAQVDCGDAAFDLAVVECEQPFFNLEFVADGVTYVLEKEDLLMTMETEYGETCVLRLTGSEGIPVSIFERDCVILIHDTFGIHTHTLSSLYPC